MQVFDPRVVQHQQERAVKQQAIATSEVLRVLVATQSRVNALATQLEAATLGTSVEGHHARSRLGPTAVPPNTGEAGKSLLDGQQVRALAQFGKVICGLKVTFHSAQKDYREFNIYVPHAWSMHARMSTSDFPRLISRLAGQRRSEARSVWV